MARRLADILAKAEPSTMAYLSDRQAGRLADAVAKTDDPNQKLSLVYNLGIQQTLAGRPDSALNNFNALDRLLAANGLKLNENMRLDLRLRRAVAYLRLGEQENCLATHNADSCLFPLQPKAYHLLPRGSRGAIALFGEQLAEFPRDLASRWLLNLAHMTLGEYPDKVPAPFLIPPGTFASEYAMPRFPDVSDGLGIDVDDLAGGVIIDDFDNDGLLDIVASSWGLEGQLRYFRHNPDGTFTQRTSEAGLVGLTSGLNIQQTDYNNDGFVDIWVLRGGWLAKPGRIPNSLVRNNGDGTFTDVTEEAGLLSFHPTQASRWFDYDGDGWLDLFIGNESTDPKDPDWCELYHNNRDGTFTECAHAAGVKVARFVKGVGCADYDNDGRPDLFLSTRDGPNLLFHNEGPDAAGQWRFSDVATAAGVTLPIYSFPTWFFDYDNDGWDDLFCSGYLLRNGVADVAADYLGMPNGGAKPKLYRNNRNGTFTDVTKAARLERVCHTMGSNYGDLDNDGWLDFYLATGDPDYMTLIPNRMFRNAEGKLFQEVTTATGTGHIQKGHGVSFADLDNDGDEDVYVVMGGAFTGDTARNALFLNPGNTNHWLKLQLTGVKANRMAIGARVKVTVQTPAGPRELHRTISSGGSFGSNPFRCEIGLANATAVTSVEIRWPGSNTKEVLKGLELDQMYTVHEGDGKAVPQTLKRVTFKPHVHPVAPRAQGGL
jgi:hypothetical protein